MSDHTIVCPTCGSTDIAVRDGKCVCWDCGHRFAAPATPSADKAPAPLRIFLSYGHTEEQIVRRIKERLEARGHQVWFDQSEIKAGNDWRDKIAEGVASSNGVIACLSKHAFRDGGVCHDEIDIAIGVRGGNIKTVLLDPEGEVRPPTAISHIQWLDMGTWREKLAAGPEVFEPWFDRCMAELIRVVESKESLQFQGEITRISERLTVLADDSRRAYLLSRPFQGRAWLAEQVASWVESRETPRVCLVTGDAGVGKSAFAAHLSHWGWKLYGRVAASFFCEAGRDLYNNPRTVIQTLAYLLACRIPQYRTLLAATLEYNRDLDAMSADDLFAFLVSEPLSHAIDGGHECMLIIIDGIDEAGGVEQNALAETLARYGLRLPAWMKLLVTSRRISAATAPFGTGVYHIDLASGSSSNMADVRDFLSARLEERFSGEPGFATAIDALAKASGGIFLYADLMADAIEKGRVTLGDAATTCPQGLSEMFYQWFRWTFPDLREYREVFRSALSCIAAAPDGVLPTSELPILFGWDGNTENDFLRRVEVFVRRQETRSFGTAIAFSHAFIAQWLESADAGAYQSLRDDAFALMGRCYLNIALTNYVSLTNYQTISLFRVLAAPGLEAEDAQLWGDIRHLGNVDDHLRWVWSDFRNAGRISKAKEIARDAVAYYDRHDHSRLENGNLYLNRHKGWVVRLADCCEETCAYAEAEELYRKELELATAAIARYRGRVFEKDARIARINALAHLGTLLNIRGKTADAAKTLESALACYEQDLAEGFDVDESLHAPLLVRLGKVFQAQGKFAQAEECFRSSIAENRARLESAKNYDQRRAISKKIAGTQTTLAKLLTSQGRSDEAAELFSEAQSAKSTLQNISIDVVEVREMLIRRRLEADDCTGDSPAAAAREDLRELVFSWEMNRPYYCDVRSGNPAEIEVHLEKQRRRSTSSATRLDTLGSTCRWLAKALYKQGDVAGARKRFEEALELFSAAFVDYREKSGKPLGSTYYLNLIMGTSNELALILHREGADDEIPAIYERTLPDPETYEGKPSGVAPQGGFEKFYQAFARALLLYGGFLADAGRRGDAREAYEWAFRFEREGEFPWGNSSAYAKTASALLEQAHSLLDAGNVEEAERLFREGLDIFICVEKRSPGHYLPGLAQAHANVGMIANNNLRAYDEALEHYAAALNIRTQLAEDEPQKYRPIIATDHISLGVVNGNLGRLDDAANEYAAAAGIYRELYAKEPDAYRTKLADALSRQRIACAGLGRVEEAQAIFSEEARIIANLDGGKATDIDISSRFFGNAGQLFVDSLLFEKHSYDKIDFTRRDAAILELNKRLDAAAEEHFSDADLDELDRIYSGDNIEEEFSAFLTQRGFDKMVAQIIQEFAAEWGDKL